MSASFVAQPPRGWRGPPHADPASASRDAGELELDLAGLDLGILGRAAAGPGTTDVFLLGDGTVWCDRGHGVERTDATLAPPAARELAVRLIALGGRHLDDASPCADVRLALGVRVHAVLPPVSVGGALISLRLPRERPFTLDELDAAGCFAEVPSDPLRAAIVARRNVLVTGAGGSGKTTLLGALLGLAPPTERLVVLEDVAELRIVHPHVVRLEARQPNLDGAGGIALDRLLREALRMRPDRLVVGECRGAETRELLAALNTGHDGGAGTLHANSLDDVPARLEALGASAGLDARALARQAVSALHLVAHLRRQPEGRRVVALGRLRLDDAGRLAIERTDR